MNLWASSRVFVDALAGETVARKSVVPMLNYAFSKSALANFDLELRYVPIVMPEELRHRHPTGSKIHKKKRLYDCAPQLDYQVFVTGNFEDQLREYVRGLAEAGDHLSIFGASKEQVEAFDWILATAADQICAERFGRSSH